MDLRRSRPARRGPPYLFAQLDGEDVAALEAGDSGAGWVSYIACDDIEQACVSVERAGGIVGVPPADGAPYGSQCDVR